MFLLVILTICRLGSGIITTFPSDTPLQIQTR